MMKKYSATVTTTSEQKLHGFRLWLSGLGIELIEMTATKGEGITGIFLVTEEHLNDFVTSIDDHIDWLDVRITDADM